MDAVAAQAEPIMIEIFSDVICPWCYIGKRRFEKALERLDPEVRDRFHIEWRPYQLDQTAPRGPGRAVVDTYAKKFGGDERAREILAHLTAVAAEDGLEYRMDLAKRANTLDAHRLLWWALTTKGSEMQWALKECLLRAYFVEGREIGVHDDLVSFASDVGLDPDAARAFLESEEGVGEVREELARANTLGITGVPAFVIGGQWVIPGAQDPDTFVRVLTRAAAQL
jgi:predicted DsbA family dithiol-disulfide isomerase